MKRREKLKVKKPEDQKTIFQRIYSKKKVYKRTAKPNMEKFVFLPKLLKYENDLSKIALSLYPVLCCAADFKENKEFQLSEEHIARMSGLNLVTVRKGMTELEDYVFDFADSEMKTLLERKMKTLGKRHFYTYKVYFPRPNIADDMVADRFIFHECIIKSGVWANLQPRAKALYLAMRTFAKFDPEIYSSVENDELSMVIQSIIDEHGYFDFGFAKQIGGESFRNRIWDVLEDPITSLCKAANLEVTNIKGIIKQLEHVGLVEKVDLVYKVFLKPKIMVRY